MLTLLLAIIYIAFISLGLPDSLLGAAWPSMQGAFGVPLSFASLVSIVITLGTIASSLLADRLIRRLGTGLVTAVSVGFTALALFGFSLSHSFWMLLVFAVPYGLGAGAVDVGLNNYVALHYSSRHMNWLHCFWGVGAALGPSIMGYCLSAQKGWSGGYRTVSFAQMGIMALLFLSLPLWGKANKSEPEKGVPAQGFLRIFKLRGAPYALLTFLLYCGIELTTGLWAASYLVLNQGIDAATAAKYASLFYIGITAGRFLCGFVSDKVGDKNMVRCGVLLLVAAIAAVALPIKQNIFSLLGLLAMGFGCAPIYPAIMHATPAHFGKEASAAMMGAQTAGAYVGTTLLPPLFGLLASSVGTWLFPLFLLLLALALLWVTERLNRVSCGGTEIEN